MEQFKQDKSYIIVYNNIRCKQYEILNKLVYLEKLTAKFVILFSDINAVCRKLKSEIKM